MNDFVILLLVACETIQPLESVRVHYGKGFQRSWEASAAGSLPINKVPTKEKLLSFLSARGTTLDNILVNSMPEHGLLNGKRVADLPTRKPTTRVDDEACAICLLPVEDDVFSCGTCKNLLHLSCLTDYVKRLESQKCVCTLPGLCNCKPAAACPNCKAALPTGSDSTLPADLKRRVYSIRKCSSSRGCTLREGHGGNCSDARPVVTDAVSLRARRSLTRRVKAHACEE